MTKEELQELRDALFPPVVGGMARPAEPIPSDLDFSLDLPQFLQQDLNDGRQENFDLRQLLSNDKTLDALVTQIKEQLANCDLRQVTQILKGLMSPEDKVKLDGIQEGATKYAHPATHPATMITQDAAHRFATDAEKTAWNGKANASHGNHVPATQTANNTVFLRNDNKWASITPGNIGAYTKAEVDSRVNIKANTNSPGFTGTPTAPTAAAAANNTQIATTAFVKAAISSGGGGIVGGSLAQNGWVKFTNGLILQWGAYEENLGYNTAVARTVTFAITYPNASLSVIVGAMDTEAAEAANRSSKVRRSSISKTGFTLDLDNISRSNKYIGAYYLAIGY